MGAGPVWAVVVAGGSGRRFGGPKQFERLADRPVVAHAVASARAACDGVVLVVPADVELPDDVGDPDIAVTGGATRAESVRAGLAAVPGTATAVAVHDAARPLAAPTLWRTVIDAVAAGADGAVPGLAVTDTVKRVAGGVDDPARPVIGTIERTQLVTVQTPQVFDAGVLRAVHAAGGEATDDAGLLEAAGHTVVVVPGQAGNLKITHAGDLAAAERWLADEVTR